MLASVVAIYALYGGWVTAARVQYPYDHLIWAESPFLTNMLRLHNGAVMYGPPADASSFVYSPGLEYICYALLAPFGKHLDLRYCRVVNVALGLGAIALAAQFMTTLARDLGGSLLDKRADRVPAVFLMTATAALVLHKNFVFDLCHPDNLHALHLAGGLALAHRALKRESFPLAIGTAALLGLGITLKQTCALGGVGIAAYLALAGRRRWGTQKAAAVVAAAIATTGICAYWLLIAHEHGRYWLLDVLVAHPKMISKIDHVFAYDAHFLHRMPLYAGALVFGLAGLFSERDDTRKATGLWLSAGLFGVAPALSAYAKQFGLYNNLIVIDLWAAMLVVPSLLHHAHHHLETRDDMRLGVLAAATLTMTALGLYPLKRKPTKDHVRYGRELEAHLRGDQAAGRNVLVGHGTAAWIRAGYRGVPKDRSNSILEITTAKRGGDLGTASRFESTVYDRVYVSWPRFGGELEEVLRKHYRVDQRIEGVGLLDPSNGNGWSVELVSPITIYVPKKPKR